MRKVNRLEKPVILQKYEKKWVKKIQLALQSGSENDLELATNKYKHKEIKNQLLKMFLGRCAYCENKYEPSDFGDIEHFRPREKFRVLSMKWKNLLLSCKRCNNLKGTKFPKPKIINPCDDNPEEHFLFDYDEILRITNVFGVTPRGQETEITLQLNREGLRRDRSVYIKKLIILAKYYVESNDIDAKNLLEQAFDENSPDAEYLAFAKIIKQKMTQPIN